MRTLLLGVAMLGIVGCTQQQGANALGAILGASLGGPMGVMAGVAAEQPDNSVWQYQSTLLDQQVAAQNAADRVQVENYNNQTMMQSGRAYQQSLVPLP